MCVYIYIHISDPCVVCLAGVNDGARSKLHKDHVSNFKCLLGCFLYPRATSPPG